MNWVMAGQWRLRPKARPKRAIMVIRPRFRSRDPRAMAWICKTKVIPGQYCAQPRFRFADRHVTFLIKNGPSIAVANGTLSPLEWDTILSAWRWAAVWATRPAYSVWRPDGRPGRPVGLVLYLQVPWPVTPNKELPWTHQFWKSLPVLWELVVRGSSWARKRGAGQVAATPRPYEPRPWRQRPYIDTPASPARTFLLCVWIDTDSYQPFHCLSLYNFRAERRTDAPQCKQDSIFNVLRFHDYPFTCLCKKKKRIKKGLKGLKFGTIIGRFRVTSWQWRG